jgi:HSP20 family molecular chaperone IbpA
LADGLRFLAQPDTPFAKFTPSETEKETLKKQGSDSIKWAVMAADVMEKPDELLVTVDAPGLDRDRVTIQIAEHQLVIAGDKPAELISDESAETGAEKNKWHIHERAYGHFERKIPLSVEVSADAAKAEYKEGVLFLHLPKIHPEPAHEAAVTIRLEGTRSESTKSKTHSTHSKAKHVEVEGAETEKSETH